MPKPTHPLPDTHIESDPAIEKRQYRPFSVADKRRILSEADACQKKGEFQTPSPTSPYGQCAQ